MAYTKEYAINSIQLLAKQLKKTPTVCDYENSALKPCRKNVAKLFGSWNNAIKEAGLTANRNYTKQDCINAIRKRVKQLGWVPFAKDMRYTKPNIATIINIYGSWNTALIDASYRPHFIYKKIKRKL
ncbi:MULTISPECIES: homing endonuclease associated repeat-containing protein [Clostridium]|mgnify:CR=1 FL=1|uniref:homing endonuclease associated repeat-containing protein n=1 Tax=Clostridium TaxID=1485 RepID=UPI00242B44B4|nr:hypothetical protein [Clostridium tyrobutyricum]